MALVELALPGAVYLYNGEELGLRERGAARLRTWPTRAGRRAGAPSAAATSPGCRCRGRATCRRSGSRATRGRGCRCRREWAGLTVEKQIEDADSTLSLYRQAIELRKTHPAFDGDELEWYGAPAGCFAFRRKGGGLVCALNTSASPIPLPPGEVLLSSSPLVDGKLPPDSAAWLV